VSKEEIFSKIYNNTYQDILRYIVIHTYNISYVNDILQETYLELWKILNKKDIEDINIKSFLIGIASNEIKKHFSILSIVNKYNYNIEDIDIKDTIDIESININKDNLNKVWEYLKKKKNQDIPKIFYLYIYEGLTIKEIANLLKRGESYVKNIIYRNLKEIKSIYEE